jgi:predicted metal-dependent peptidase
MLMNGGHNMSKESTATDIHVEVDENAVQLTKKELEEHIIRLMIEEPFYAGVLRGVNRVRTTSVPTAGVSTKGTEITMFWNPAWISTLDRDHIKGLLKHEAMHLALMHTTNRRMTPHIVHNYATDLAINSDIPKSELPPGGLIPGEEFKDLTDKQMEKMGSDSIDRYYRISKKISKMPKNKSSEWYFAEIMNDEELSEDIQDEGKGSDSLIGMDEHDWEGLSEEDKQIVREKIRQAVSDSVKKCDSSGKWGSVSHDLKKTLRKIVSKEVDWRSVLRKFCGLSRRGTRSTSWTKINKKYPGVSPGVKRGYQSNIAVYIDQSGSVSSSDLELAFAELASLTKRTSFTTFHFDTSVDVKSETEWNKGSTPEAYRSRCGGTCFESVSVHARKNMNRFDGCIIITDGQAPKPSSSKMKRGWLLVPNTKLAFNNDKSDFVIKMTERS